MTKFGQKIICVSCKFYVTEEDSWRHPLCLKNARTIDVDSSEAEVLFEILDLSGDGSIDREDIFSLMPLQLLVPDAVPGRLLVLLLLLWLLVSFFFWLEHVLYHCVLYFFIGLYTWLWYFLVVFFLFVVLWQWPRLDSPGVHQRMFAASRCCSCRGSAADDQGHTKRCSKRVLSMSEPKRQEKCLVLYYCITLL